jgi:hypothetical protein
MKGDRRAATLGIAGFGRSLKWFVAEAPLALRQHLGRCWEIRRTREVLDDAVPILAIAMTAVVLQSADIWILLISAEISKR